jgi:cytochrome c2
MPRLPPELVHWLAVAICAALLVACRDPANDGSTRDAAPEPRPARPARVGDAMNGAEWVEQFECHRCHAGTGLDSPPKNKDCRVCHRSIEAGEFPIASGTLVHWQARIRHFVDVPSLTGAPRRFRRSFIARFLMEPFDLRPRFEDTMPRLALTQEQAEDIAAYLTPDDDPPTTPPKADPTRGRRLLDTRGCGTCHVFSGVAPLDASEIPMPVDAARLALAMKLAPDLRFARDRLLPSALEKWIRRPSELRRDALMPDLGISSDEARDIAAYLVTAPLAPAAVVQVPAPLPVLDRPVTWDEVNREVFHDTCWHCHSDPEFAYGDGGPGNTGGFGFEGRGITLAAYEQVEAGYVDSKGERRSLFTSTAPVSPATVQEPDAPGLLMRSLLARQSEQAGRPIAGVRGMPLALPALSPEKIQLVRTWIAQGRPE